MRTYRRLFPRLVSASHLDLAATATVEGKRRRPDVAWFLFRREAELARLQDELLSGSYRPEPPELITIRDPKPRMIARVPIADRVVHTALVSLMEPIFFRRLRPEAFACRPGYGTHRAVLRLQELLRRHDFALHLDIKSYFPSIHRETLRGLLARPIRDPAFLAVVDRVLDTAPGLYDDPQVRAAAHLDPDWPPPGRGLPIGSYTSQLFAAHVYLSDLDHWVKRQLKVPGYVRYVDDLFFFGSRRNELRQWRGAIEEWLFEHRHLRLKHPRAPVLSCRGTLDALGYRLRRDGIWARPRAYRRLQRRIVAHMTSSPRGRDQVDLERSLAASAGVLLF